MLYCNFFDWTLPRHSPSSLSHHIELQLGFVILTFGLINLFLAFISFEVLTSQTFSEEFYILFFSFNRIVLLLFHFYFLNGGRLGLEPRGDFRPTDLQSVTIAALSPTHMLIYIKFFKSYP